MFFAFIITAILVIIPISATLTTEEKCTYDITCSLEAVLENNVYDEKLIFTKGVQEIEIISNEIDEFAYWKDCEIVDFKFLHSFETGNITHALFEVLGSNNQYGYMIYDCVHLESDSFSAAESPYNGTDIIISREKFNAEIGSDQLYYFYAPMTYGVGVLNDDEISIYNVECIKTKKFDEVVCKTKFN